MVFQHFALLPHRSVRQNTEYGLRIRGVDPDERRERAEWALREVGLSARAEAFPGQLSGGMRQRVGLARALASDTDVLHRLGAAEANGAYVVDDDNRLLGVVRDDWLAMAAHQGMARIAADGLSADYRSTEADRPLIDLVDQVGRNVVPLAVVDEHKRLMGVVPRGAVLAALAVPNRSASNRT